MIYIKVRKQVSQVSQVVTLSPMKQEKALRVSLREKGDDRER